MWPAQVCAFRITLLAGSILGCEYGGAHLRAALRGREPALLISYGFLNRDSSECPLCCLDSVSSDRYERLWKWLSLYGASVVARTRQWELEGGRDLNGRRRSRTSPPSVSQSLTHSFTHSLDPPSLLRFVLSLNELLVCTSKRTAQAPLRPEAAIKTNGVAD